jgi:hypothetical protein
MLIQFNDEIIGIELPASVVELVIAQTEPGIQGDRVSGARKVSDVGNRLRGPGAVVRGAGRDDQGRHPHRRIHDAGVG